MTPTELDEFAAKFSGLADVGRVVAALREAWAERDGLSATLQAREDAQIQDRVTFRKELASEREMHDRAESHCRHAEDIARIALAERDARPDAATVEKVRHFVEELIDALQEGEELHYENCPQDDSCECRLVMASREALRLLEGKP